MNNNSVENNPGPSQQKFWRRNILDSGTFGKNALLYFRPHKFAATFEHSTDCTCCDFGHQRFLENKSNLFAPDAIIVTLVSINVYQSYFMEEL
jgi:hypothetical protein